MGADLSPEPALRHVLLQDPRHASCREAGPPGVDEQGSVRPGPLPSRQHLVPPGKVGLQGLDCLAPDGDHPLLPSFSGDPGNPQMKVHVPVAQADQFAHPDPAGVKGLQHGAVPGSPRCGFIRGSHQGKDLIHGQKSGQVLFLLGSGHNLRRAPLQDSFIHQIPEETPLGRKLSSERGFFKPPIKMAQEGANGQRVDRLHPDVALFLVPVETRGP